ncbi:hypothetical protein C2E23DRAFT_870931 [Lenzites betulinus]|nr:hypothetical protein C2E23DRAFT_870931 [Lenzites betulinus]
MRLIITGVTGVAGLAAYRAAVVDSAVDGITLLTRRPVPTWAKLPPQAAQKTTTILHQDFKTYPPDLARQLAENDALVWALGKSSMGMSEEQYNELTYEYTMAAARALKDAGAGSPERPFRFVFVSGEHADPTGESRQAWARIKGRVEKELPELFEGTNLKVHVYRPGYFFPSKNYPEDRKNQRSLTLRVLDTVLAPVLATLVPASNTPVADLGRFVVELAKGRWPDRMLFRNTDMQTLIKELPTSAAGAPAKEEL